MAIAQDPESKILSRKLENARKRLAVFEKEDHPEIYRTVPIRPELSGKIAAYCLESSERIERRILAQQQPKRNEGRF